MADVETVALEFAGRRIAARRGESVAAALTRAGVRAFGAACDGTSRGLFCGMGVCQDCVLPIDGVLRRSCMTAVSDSHRVGALPPHDAPCVPPIEIGDVPVVTPDVLVIGGGAAGLSAATAAAQAGAAVTLLDERTRAGGQYFKQPAPGVSYRDDAQFAGGRALIAAAGSVGVRIINQASVWAVAPPREIAVSTSDGLVLYRPRALVVATGAYERGLPVPGWTLPGVITTGAAQTLLRGEGTLVGRRVLVCGNGPLNLQVALELARHGAHVLGIAELAERPRLRDAAALLTMATSDPRLVLQGAALLRGLRRHGVPVWRGHVLCAVAAGEDGVELHASIARWPDLSEGKSVDVDAVCMGYGFKAANEVLRGLGCRHRFDGSLADLITERDPDGATSVGGVFAAGDCCGLGGTKAAMAEGLIAGFAAAAHAGFLSGVQTKRAVRRARQRLTVHRRFQASLWRVYAAPWPGVGLLRPDDMLCRCERVTCGTVQAAITEFAPSIDELKRRTRAGMGGCQGRYCAPLLAALLAQESGIPPNEHAFFAPRAPIKPIAIADLVRPAAT